MATAATVNNNNSNTGAMIQFRTTIGSVSEYKPGEDWQTWEERLDQYFEARYVDEHKKVLQSKNEPVRQWYIRIKNKASSCDFGNLLHDVLKYRFVTGLTRGPILDRVCEENPTKKLDELIEVALKNEAALSSYTQ
ncbi:hypothetical protein ILUMI_19493, partial [Ignelater luminosus]